ncbi:MAG: lysylphosphatidylglycerol synthase transmembrane domain-containing protein [Candidatus Diapherotrites archaeon]
MISERFDKISAAKSFQNALLLLLFLSALFVVIIGITDAFDEIKNTDFLFLVSSVAFYVLSVVVWTIAWTNLIRKEHYLKFYGAIVLGLSSMFASLTPMQLGTDALRSYLLKQRYKVPFSKGISASMLIKGTKFLTLVLFFVVIVFVPIVKLNLTATVIAMLLLGLLVISVASLLFLLPLSRRASSSMIRFVQKLAKRWKTFQSIEVFLGSYSAYTNERAPTLIKTFGFCLIAFLFEFLSFSSALLAVNVFMPVENMFFFFVIIAVLERTPFLPRGIGLVELTSYVFLSTGSLAILSKQQIVSFIAVLDLARIIIPTAISLLMFSLLQKIRL